MVYKDQTFCHDWCDNKECFRNYSHIVEANEKKLIPDYMPVCYFVDIPVDCNKRIPKDV